MITPLTLDNLFPPTWDGTTAPLLSRDDVSDVATRLRCRERQDKYNYLTEQRIEGDLFKRDLVIYESLRQLIDFLSTREGMVLSLTSTVLAASSYISLGKIMCPSDKLTGGWVVYSTIDDLEFAATSSGGSYSAPAASSVKLEVCKVSSSNVVESVLFSVNGATAEADKWGADLMTERGPILVANATYDVRLTNLSDVADACCSARLVWNNKTV